MWCEEAHPRVLRPSLRNGGHMGSEQQGCRACELRNLLARCAGRNTGKQDGVSLQATHTNVDHRCQGLVEQSPQRRFCPRLRNNTIDLRGSQERDRQWVSPVAGQQPKQGR